jgi:nucleoside-diphosphate-sugar epimerase
VAEGRRLFIFGLGYSAGFLARDLLAKGWRVGGTSREASGQAAGGTVPPGVEVYRFDRGHPLDPCHFKDATCLLSSVPPDEKGDPVLDVLGDVIAQMKQTQWVGYLSTTGVYGDRQGGWVDEESALRPTGERSRRRVEAETRWLDLWRNHGVPVHAFRLAGIYGPGRSPLDTVREGSAHRIDKPGHVFSRIHAEDISGALQASMAKPKPGRVYNVCDNEAAPPQDVVGYSCELLGVEPPPLEPIEAAGLSPMALSFYAGNKRVSNRRLTEELGYQLKYPTYREGLKAILGGGGGV